MKAIKIKTIRCPYSDTIIKKKYISAIEGRRIESGNGNNALVTQWRINLILVNGLYITYNVYNNEKDFQINMNALESEIL